MQKGYAAHQKELSESAFLGTFQDYACRADKCSFCKEDATEFRDGLSRKEYTISGLCQLCQDAIRKDATHEFMTRMMELLARKLEDPDSIGI